LACFAFFCFGLDCLFASAALRFGLVFFGIVVEVVQPKTN
jgi:hypothetical protein